MSRDTDGDDPPANGHPLYMQTLGEIIRRARVQRRISQERLGELTGVSRSAVAQWESGRTVPDSADRLRRIAEALQLDPANLVRASGPSRGSRSADIVRIGTSRSSPPSAALVVWKSVPARGSRFGGFVLLAEKDGEVPRPEFLQYSQKAFSFRVIEEANKPVYRLRDHLLVDPEMPAVEGDDCLFADGVEEAEGSAGIVGNLVRSTTTLWIIRQYNVKGETELPKSDYPHVWPIVGRYMRR